MSARRLLVVRHAQAEPYAGSDHARALTAKGRRAASDLGRQIAEQGLVPDYAMVSSATRTRQTWAAMCEALGAVDIHTEFSDDLYHAGPEDVIEAVRWAPVDCTTLVYVGHNPTAGELPHLLDNGEGDRALLAEIALGYPTAAVSVFEVDGPWSELGAGGARLMKYFVGARS